MYQIVLFSNIVVESQVNIRERKVMELFNFVASKEGQLVNVKESFGTCDKDDSFGIKFGINFIA